MSFMSLYIALPATTMSAPAVKTFEMVFEFIPPSTWILVDRFNWSISDLAASILFIEEV